MSTVPSHMDTTDTTLTLLWARVRQRGNLPGFSKAVKAVLDAMQGDEDSEFNMTKTVLSDPALTQRVLRLANSAMYSVFGQSINTVSKAVIVLGTESIGHLALGLKVIDGLSSMSSDSIGTRRELEKAVFAGHIARQVASSASARDVEETVVCSILHSLGRMMLVFYLPERWALVQAHIDATGQGESDAAHRVLGIGFDELGRQIGLQWGLPAQLLNAMRNFPPKTVGEPLDHADWLAAVSTMSSSCAQIMCDDDLSAVNDIAQLADAYADMLGLDASQVMSAFNAAKLTAAEDAVFQHSTNAIVLGAVLVPTMQPLRSGKPADAALLLAHGVLDMRSALADASSAQMMTMALETVFKGLGLSSAVLFFRQSSDATYAARLGFGDGVQDLLPQLTFSDAYQPDVFHAALANDKMIFVENALASTFASKLPRWWKEAFPTTRSFMALPLTINRKPVGFIYGDWKKTFLPVDISADEIPALDEIRGIVTAILERRCKQEPTWML